MSQASTDEALAIVPLERPLNATVTVPGSKSLTNRALLIAALAAGRSVLTGALASDDTRYMAGALRALGISVEQEDTAAGARFTVQGQGGRFPVSEAEIFIGASGTAARFLTAALALGHGRYVLDGVPLLRARPIGP